MTYLTLPINPDVRASGTVGAQVLRAQFAQDFSTRNPDGINPVMATYSARWSVKTLSERLTILSFLQSLGGTQAFYFQRPGDVTPLLWSCGKWGDTPDSNNSWTITADFMQEIM